jgi:hypothetical protein
MLEIYENFCTSGMHVQSALNVLFCMAVTRSLLRHCRTITIPMQETSWLEFGFQSLPHDFHGFTQYLQANFVAIFQYRLCINPSFRMFSTSLFTNHFTF